MDKSIMDKSIMDKLDDILKLTAQLQVECKELRDITYKSLEPTFIKSPVNLEDLK